MGGWIGRVVSCMHALWRLPEKTTTKKRASYVHIEYSVMITISGQNGQLADIKPMQHVTTRPHADMQWDGRGLENMHTWEDIIL